MGKSKPANNANTQNNTTAKAADNCANGHIANNGQCSIVWCAFNRWPDTWPENKAR